MKNSEHGVKDKMAQSRDKGNSEFYRNLLAKVEDLAVSTESESIRELVIWLRENRDKVTPDERLAVYKKARNAGILPKEASFHLVAWTIMTIADDRIMDEQDTALSDVETRMKKARGVKRTALRKEWDSIVD